ncbi:sporulation histidine kinase inhibitor Sda [Evansella sp. AB-rgal1]
MFRLTDKQLLEAYHQALELDLDEEFLIMLREEIENRELCLEKILI